MVIRVSGLTFPRAFSFLHDNDKRALPAMRNTVPHLANVLQKPIINYAASRNTGRRNSFSPFLLNHLDRGTSRNPTALHVVCRPRSRQAAEEELVVRRERTAEHTHGLVYLLLLRRTVLEQRTGGSEYVVSQPINGLTVESLAGGRTFSIRLA